MVGTHKRRSHHRIIPWIPLFIFYKPHIRCVPPTECTATKKGNQTITHNTHNPQNFLLSLTCVLFPFLYVCNNHRSCSLVITPEVTSRIHNLHSAANLLDKVLAEWENNENRDCCQTLAIFNFCVVAQNSFVRTAKVHV